MATKLRGFGGFFGYIRRRRQDSHGKRQIMGTTDIRNLAAAALMLALAAPAALISTAPTALAGDLAAAAGRVGAQLPDAGRRAVPCPPQTGRTMVALLLGQSNAANHGETRSASRRGVVSLFDGVCFVAADPLPGATGDGGGPWPALGDALLDSGAFDRVVLVPAAVNGAQVARWAPGGDLSPWLEATVASARGVYRFTHVFWVQGESDLLLDVDAAAYQAGVRGVVDHLRRLGVAAPLHMTVTSGFCGRPRGQPPAPDNPVRRAQQALIAAGDGICGGPDTDTLLAAPGDRFDGCHMSRQGADKLAAAWTALLSRPVAAIKNTEFACPQP